MNRHRAATCLAALCFIGLGWPSKTLAAPSPIQLVAPANGESFGACSYSKPPVFQWATTATFKLLEVRLSADGFATIPLVKVKAKRGAYHATLSKSSWAKVLRLAGSEVSWKVVGLAPDKSVVESERSSFFVAPYEGVGDPTVVVSEDRSEAALSWENRCNTKFYLWFSGSDSFKKRQKIAVTVADPAANAGVFRTTLAGRQWRAIEALAPPTGTLYYYVECWDALKRHYASPVAACALPPPPPPAAPILSTPTNGAAAVAVDATLKWKTSPGATAYQLQLAADPSFSAPIADRSELTALTLRASGLTNDETYYWRVRAWNPGGPGEWSAVWHFGTTPGPPLRLESYDLGFGNSIRKPEGWDVYIGGVCTTLGFVVQDPKNPLHQIFYFTNIGPVYIDQKKKDFDQWYVSHGGFPIEWADAPVVDPLTMGNFFSHWPEIADMQLARRYLDQFPSLDQLQISTVTPEPYLFPTLQGGETALLRGVFEKEGAVAEGQFYGTVVPDPGDPSGKGRGFVLLGATSPKREFSRHIGNLVASIESFTVTSAYLDYCTRLGYVLWGAVAEAGRTLSEASDLLYDGWMSRTRASDIMIEKDSDGILGLERVYDPSTGEVYSVESGWYDRYDLIRETYQLSDLQLLTGDDYGLWTAAPLDGGVIR